MTTELSYAEVDTDHMDVCCVIMESSIIMDAIQIPNAGGWSVGTVTGSVGACDNEVKYFLVGELLLRVLCKAHHELYLKSHHQDITIREITREEALVKLVMES